jgi:hypothetical protein
MIKKTKSIRAYGFAGHINGFRLNVVRQDYYTLDFVRAAEI